MKTNPMKAKLLGAVVAIVVAVTVVYATTFTDNFTEAATVDLILHVASPTSGTWSEVEDTATTLTLNNHTSDYVTPSGLSNSNRIIYTVSWTPGDANYSAAYTLVVGIPTTNDDPAAIIARYADTSNYYALLLTTTATNTVKLIKVSGGTRTELASADVTIALSDVWQFELKSSTLKGYQNSTERVCAVDGTITAAGVIGIGAGNIGPTTTDDITTAWRWDDLTMVDGLGSGAGCGAAGVRSGLLLGVGP